MNITKNRVNIFDCPIDNLTMVETISLIDFNIKNKILTHHVVVNAAKLVYIKDNISLFNSVVECDIINADGQAVVWASKILNYPLKERVTGIDLMYNLIKLSVKNNYKIFFLGSDEINIKKTIVQISKQYNKNIIAGYHNGYFGFEDEHDIVQKIKKSSADILFVGISSPKKEIFLKKYKNSLNVPFIMGVGGSFDIISGKVSRAPIWMQGLGLEWFYRFIKEPKRMWRRYLYTNVIFIYRLVKEKLNKYRG